MEQIFLLVGFAGANDGNTDDTDWMDENGVYAALQHLGFGLMQERFVVLRYNL